MKLLTDFPLKNLIRSCGNLEFEDLPTILIFISNLIIHTLLFVKMPAN